MLQQSPTAGPVSGTSKSKAYGRWLVLALVAGLQLGCDEDSDPTGPDSGGPNAPLLAACGNNPNYLSDFQGAHRRWRNFPLAVHVDASNAPSGRRFNRELLEEGMFDGAMAWLGAGGGIGDVVRASSAESADVRITFGSQCSSSAAGCTFGTGISSDGYQTSADVVINRDIARTWTTRQTPQRLAESVVIHEMGHVFFAHGGPAGGHPTSTTDTVLNGTAVFRVTSTDLNSIREAYCQPSPLDR